MSGLYGTASPSLREVLVGPVDTLSLDTRMLTGFFYKGDRHEWKQSICRSFLLRYSPVIAASLPRVHPHQIDPANAKKFEFPLYTGSSVRTNSLASSQKIWTIREPIRIGQNDS